MLSLPSIDDALRDIQERHAWAQHEALARHASASSVSRQPALPRLSPIRNRAAAALRDLACRLDPAVCIEWT